MLIAFGLLTFTVGCPKSGDTGTTGGADDVKLKATTVSLKAGESKEVDVTSPKDAKDVGAPTVDPKDKGVTAEVKGGKVKVTASDTAEGTYKITVKGKGKSETLTATVAKKEGGGTTPPPPPPPAAKDVKLDKDSVDVKQGESATVNVTDGTAEKVDAPAESKVTGTVEGNKVTIKADKDAKEGEVKVTVKASKDSKGKDAELKVNVKK